MSRHDATHERSLEPWWLTALRDQQRSGFAEVAGARAAMELPVADWWLSGVLTNALKPESPVREIAIQAFAGNRFTVRVRLRRPSFLPPIKVALTIESQPSLPDTPVLVLRIERDGVTDIARTALKFLDALPPGIHLEGDRILIDLKQLSRRHGFAELFEHLTIVRVTTLDGRLVVLIEAEAANSSKTGTGP